MDKVAAIEAFVAQQDLETKLVAIAQAVAARSPHAVLVFWEDDVGYGWTTLPFSRALAYGLADKAYDLICLASGAAAEDDDEDDDDADA